MFITNRTGILSYERMNKMKAICNKDCDECSQLNIKTDKLGYPWSYECLKYDDSVLYNEFYNTKEFEVNGE